MMRAIAKIILLPVVFASVTAWTWSSDIEGKVSKLVIQSINRRKACVVYVQTQDRVFGILDEYGNCTFRNSYDELVGYQVLINAGELQRIDDSATLAQLKQIDPKAFYLELEEEELGINRYRSTLRLSRPLLSQLSRTAQRLFTKLEKESEVCTENDRVKSLIKNITGSYNKYALLKERLKDLDGERVGWLENGNFSAVPAKKEYINKALDRFFDGMPGKSLYRSVTRVLEASEGKVGLWTGSAPLFQLSGGRYLAFFDIEHQEMLTLAFGGCH